MTIHDEPSGSVAHGGSCAEKLKPPWLHIFLREKAGINANLSWNFAEGGRPAIYRRDFRNDFNDECASRISWKTQS